MAQPSNKALEGLEIDVPPFASVAVVAQITTASAMAGRMDSSTH
jgi:hypothetical protein